MVFHLVFAPQLYIFLIAVFTVFAPQLYIFVIAVFTVFFSNDVFILILIFTVSCFIIFKYYSINNFITVMYSGSYYTVWFRRKYVVEFFSTLNSCMGSFQMHCII